MPMSGGMQTTVLPSGLELARGSISKLTLKGLTGINSAVGASYETVSEVGGIIPANLSTAETFKVKSSSADDTNSGSGHARRVQIRGIDANGAELIENVELNGVTAVDTVGSFVCVNELRVNKLGSGGTVNAGDISCFQNDGTTLVNKIKAGENNSQTCRFTVPATVAGYITSFAFDSIGEAQMSIWIDQGNGVFQQKLSFLVKDTLITYQLPNPFAISKGGTVEFRAKRLGASDVKCGADFQLIMEED